MAARSSQASADCKRAISSARSSFASAAATAAWRVVPQFLLRLAQQLITPVERGAQRLVPRQRGAAPACQQGETILQSAHHFARAQCRRAGGRELDRERDAVEASTDRGDRQHLAGAGGSPFRRASPRRRRRARRCRAPAGDAARQWFARGTASCGNFPGAQDQARSAWASVRATSAGSDRGARSTSQPPSANSAPRRLATGQMRLINSSLVTSSPAERTRIS